MLTFYDEHILFTGTSVSEELNGELKCRLEAALHAQSLRTLISADCDGEGVRGFPASDFKTLQIAVGVRHTGTRQRFMLFDMRQLRDWIEGLPRRITPPG